MPGLFGGLLMAAAIVQPLARPGLHQRWHLVDYFRARVAGSAVARCEDWDYPVFTPQAALDCAAKAVSHG